MPTMIVIEQTKPSQSGKTIGILSGGVWYSCKDFTLGNMVGQPIMANTSVQSFPDGGSINWINDWSGGTTPGHQIPPQSMPDGQVQAVQAAPLQGQQNPGPANLVPAPMAPPAAVHQVNQPTPNQGRGVDRDASIVAQTLCKTIQFSSVDAAFAAYTGLYELVKEWQATGRTPQAEASQQMPHDEIPC